MLTEAIRRHKRGEDVVIAGVVETHGRKGIAELVPQLECVPRRKIDYKGTLFEEMDVRTRLSRGTPRLYWSTSWRTRTFPGASTASGTRTCSKFS